MDISRKIILTCLCITVFSQAKAQDKPSFSAYVQFDGMTVFNRSFNHFRKSFGDYYHTKQRPDRIHSGLGYCAGADVTYKKFVFGFAYSYWKSNITEAEYPWPDKHGFFYRSTTLKVSAGKSFSKGKFDVIPRVEAGVGHKNIYSYERYRDGTVSYGHYEHFTGEFGGLGWYGGVGASLRYAVKRGFGLQANTCVFMERAFSGTDKTRLTGRVINNGKEDPRLPVDVKTFMEDGEYTGKYVNTGVMGISFSLGVYYTFNR